MTLGGENPNPEEGGRWRNDLGGRGGREVGGGKGGGSNSMGISALALLVELHICFRQTRS